MKKCIYCDKETLESELTLEHSIPHFLGGAFAPDRFKVTRVCSRCNGALGLFVDGAFARTYWVSNWLASAARACYDLCRPIGVPLVCMGTLELNPPEMREDELCELWLGPQGELVYWVRAKDERLYWFVGGNPITAKQRETAAYFFFSENSHRDTMMTWLAFQEAFSEARVRKIMCTEVQGTDPATIGFCPHNALDEQRCAYFRAVAATRDAKSSISLYLPYDFRFMSKLALGVGYALFGERVLSSPYTAELRKWLWHREGDPEPLVRGVPALHTRDPLFKELTGRPHAVVLMITKLREGVALNLNICRQLCWTVMCADSDIYDASLPSGIEGEVIVMYPFLQKSVQMPLVEFVIHDRSRPHPELSAIESRLK